MPEPLRIVMADGNCPVREGARRLLEDSDVVVAAAVGSAPDLLDAVERLRPAAVLTDIRMPASQRGLPEQALCRAVLAAAVVGCAGGPVSGGRLAARRRRR
jgi:CheY-like chemotaxis protein